MGDRSIKKEAKKPKKSASKDTVSTSVNQGTAQVPVIKKEKKSY